MDETGGAIREKGSCIEVCIKVTTRSSRRGCNGCLGEQVRFSLHAPPVDDAANRELVEVLAGGLRVSRGSVKIVSGARSRQKVVRIEGINRAEFENAFLKKQP